LRPQPSKNPPRGDRSGEKLRIIPAIGRPPETGLPWRVSPRCQRSQQTAPAGANRLLVERGAGPGRRNSVRIPPDHQDGQHENHSAAGASLATNEKGNMPKPPGARVPGIAGRWPLANGGHGH
jgi:hypothetical protein